MSLDSAYLLRKSFGSELSEAGNAEFSDDE